MNIHEYQAKSLLRTFGVAVPGGRVAFTSQEAREVAEALKGPLWVVKAQIHAGGRGKGGGVKLAKSIDEVASIADQILGMTLITPQTGPQGRLVSKIYVEEGCSIDREFYLSLLVDRITSRVTFLASTEGGVEIEDVALTHPEKIIRASIDPAVGFQSFQGRKLAYGLGLKGDQVKELMRLAKGMYEAFLKLDASLIEINPLVLTREGTLLALDAKMSFDDNALYRHQEIEDLRDATEEDPVERHAFLNELSYIKLDGNIGCMVNGAGLAMATMDIIKLYGGAPANFLDVGGGAPRERVTEAFKIILSDPHVKGVLVNIFGGIMRCDIIAEGIVEAVKEIHLQIPLVVRLEGTNVDLGKEIFTKSGLPIISLDDLSEAAQRIVEEVKEAV
ncbi:MAG: ADP-forming succinate--CoA ligase subunit beta [Alphaproteobacteria bacterium]|nr:ADP-forming succinate--CoA ligase subunit beta [Alphaproteobacteria bacterium]MBP9776525.1 ADP-forming succinate--CoA ligase subunit beta [Alphaproteobacteria bacterium]